MRTSAHSMHKISQLFFVVNSSASKYTIAEATLPFEPGTRPVNSTPYRANPCIQETTDKCVNQVEQDGIIEQRSSAWGSAGTVVAKSDGTRRFCVDYQVDHTKKTDRKVLAYA